MSYKHLCKFLPESGTENVVCVQCGKTKKKEANKAYGLKKATKPLKKSRLRKEGKGSISQCKKRIQKLLTEGVRLRDKGCIFGNYPETGKCGGYTAADHIISRKYHLTYALLRNCIEVCFVHHIRWKPENPTIYAEIVRKCIKSETWKELHKLREKSPKVQSYSLKEWEAREKELVDEIAKIYTYPH